MILGWKNSPGWRDYYDRKKEEHLKKVELIKRYAILKELSPAAQAIVRVK